MAGRFDNPYPQFFDSTPNVYSGGKLWFYASGTSTPLATYSNSTLLSANTNPVILNSAGRASVDIFLQDLPYKVVLKDSSDNIIWTADPYYGRDSALIAKTLTGAGSPSGVVAGTAGSASILPDFYWDYTNSILYVCTTTGVAASAVWTAVNASASTPAVPTPQGRLTPTSATPIIATGVTSGTAVYYTPYVGNLVPIYNGSSMIPTEFAELTLTLSASHALSTFYDVFVFSNSGVLTLATGPAWTTMTAGAGSRGTGASTSELTRVKGLYVNAVSMTGRNGATTYTIGANLATYLGSIFIDGTAGQVTCHTAYGQSRKWGVWNAYNRTPIILRAGDATASWTYTTATIRAANGASANSITVFSGLPEEIYDFAYSAKATNANAGPETRAGIGFNSTTAFSGYNGARFVTTNDLGTPDPPSIPTSNYTAVPSIGMNTVTALEYSSASGTTTWYGTEANMLLTAKWRS